MPTTTLRTIFQTVATHLETHRDDGVYLHMPSYVQECGTSACVLGWAAQLVPACAPNERDEARAIEMFGTSSESSIVSEAAHRVGRAICYQLGDVSSITTDLMFYAWDNNRMLDYLEGRGWENQSHILYPYMDQEIEL